MSLPGCNRCKWRFRLTFGEPKNVMSSWWSLASWERATPKWDPRDARQPQIAGGGLVRESKRETIWVLEKKPGVVWVIFGKWYFAYSTGSIIALTNQGSTWRDRKLFVWLALIFSLVTMSIAISFAQILLRSKWMQQISAKWITCKYISNMFLYVQDMNGFCRFW